MADDETQPSEQGADAAAVPGGAEDRAPAGAGRRRRPPRSWSTATPSERFDRPSADASWGWNAPAAATPGPAPTTPARTMLPRDVPPPPQPVLAPERELPPIGPAIARPAPAPEGPTLAEVLGELQAEFAQLRDVLADAASERSPDEPTVLTAAELASAIDSLGISLGNGMATLLSDHRALLARDVEAGADRVMEDVGRRLRTTTNQVVDGVEAKVRHLHAQSMAALADQIDGRIDQLQADVAGLRAVLLELPDQTELTTRLDLIADGLADLNADRAREAVSTKVAPGLLAALETALATPMERLEELLGGATEQLVAAAEAQRQAQVGELDGEDVSGAAGLAKLTKEVVALRRRIGLRADAGAVELTDEQLDAIADRVAARLQGSPTPAPAAKRTAKGPAATDDGSGDDDEPTPTARRRGRLTTPDKAPSATAAARRRATR